VELVLYCLQEKTPQGQLAS